MRSITIVTGEEIIDGKRFPIELKAKGFAKDEATARAVLTAAGFSADTDFAIEVCRSANEFFDTDYEVDLEQQKLVGNPDYGWIDSDFTGMPPQRIVPCKGESWVFILNMSSYLN